MNADAIKGEILLIQLSKAELPPQGFYLAGLIRKQTSLPAEIIMKFLRTFYDRVNSGLVSQSLQEEIEVSIYQGNLATAKEAIQAEAVINEALCNYCESPIVLHELSTLENCSHLFHSSCLIDYIDAQLALSNSIMHCPATNCGKVIADYDLRTLSKTLFERYQEVTLQVFLAISPGVLYCPICHIPMIVEGELDVNCPNCKSPICGKCKGLKTACLCAREQSEIKCPNCGTSNSKHHNERVVCCNKCCLLFCSECANNICECQPN